jgi:hypothetical protein
LASPGAGEQAAAAAEPSLTPPPESTEPPKVELKPEDDPQFSAKFTALTRRVREQEKREAAFKKSQSDPAWKTYQEATKSRNPVKVLESLGMSLQDVADFVLNDGKETDSQRIARLEKELQDDRSKKEEEQKRQDMEYNERALAQHRKNIREFVEQGGDAYELIQAHGAHEAVLETINEHWLSQQDENGESLTGEPLAVMPIKEAAEKVEAYLEEQAKKLLSAKKFAPKVNPAVQDNTPPNDAKTPASQTLTNRAVTAMPPPEDTSNLSDDESKARAAALLQSLISGKR